jgi:hypothetical protein
MVARAPPSSARLLASPLPTATTRTSTALSAKPRIVSVPGSGAGATWLWPITPCGSNTLTSTADGVAPCTLTSTRNVV